MSEQVRFNNSWMPVTESGCWIWMRGCQSGGYGSFYLGGGKQILAHRYAYEQHYGPVPNGLFLDHLCRVRCCVNPSHLEAVTTRTNLLRGIGFTAINAAKQACPVGHSYTVYEGFRQCRTCLNNGKRLHYWGDPDYRAQLKNEMRIYRENNKEALNRRRREKYVKRRQPKPQGGSR